MLKKEIKSIFKAIRGRDLALVKQLVSEKPQLVNVCNFAPPKKDDGQSPLQVAFKLGEFKIAEFLISEGADVHFKESSDINEWTAPVIHDCIRAVAFSSFTLQATKKEFDEGLEVLELIISKGVLVNSEDSYGNNCLHRAILDSKQMISHPNSRIENGIVIEQFKRLFYVLLKAGADMDVQTKSRPSARELMSDFSMEKYNLV